MKSRRVSKYFNPYAGSKGFLSGQHPGFGSFSTTGRRAAPAVTVLAQAAVLTAYALLTPTLLTVLYSG